MTAKYFSVVSLAFDLNSEKLANNMIAAAIANVDMSEHKFGLNILSCDNIVYDGLDKESIGMQKRDNNGALYLVYHSPEFQDKKLEIAYTRLQQYGLQGWTVYYLSRLWHFTGGRISPQY